MNDWEEDGDPWIVNGTAIAFANDWFRIESHAVTQPGGGAGTYSIIW